MRGCNQVFSIPRKPKWVAKTKTLELEAVEILIVSILQSKIRRCFSEFRRIKDGRGIIPSDKIDEFRFPGRVRSS
uniref:NEFA-interacting nuclear protein NIP30 n=1 Tax=Rhizophora mucronata TaxID=61149 RepID=A0A2P2KT29_RHIMU